MSTVYPKSDNTLGLARVEQPQGELSKGFQPPSYNLDGIAFSQDDAITVFETVMDIMEVADLMAGTPRGQAAENLLKALANSGKRQQQLTRVRKGGPFTSDVVVDALDIPNSDISSIRFNEGKTLNEMAEQVAPGYHLDFNQGLGILRLPMSKWQEQALVTRSFLLNKMLELDEQGRGVFNDEGITEINNVLQTGHADALHSAAIAMDSAASLATTQIGATPPPQHKMAS